MIAADVNWCKGMFLTNPEYLKDILIDFCLDTVYFDSEINYSHFSCLIFYDESAKIWLISYNYFIQL
jgi:hypothetical protein